MKSMPIGSGRVAVTLALAAGIWATVCLAQNKDPDRRAGQKYRGLLGADSKKIKHQGNKTLIWAGGGDPSGPDAKWYEFTGSVIPAAKLQFGIGKDRIRAIDDPLFVAPDDPRLLKIRPSHYRREQRPAVTDDIQVAGYVVGEEARAYPVGLLDYHELVNDEFSGKPVTVGW